MHNYRLFLSTAAASVFGCLLTCGAPLVSAQTSVPVITSASTASAQVGQPFSYQITASNAPASFGTSALPPGLGTNIPSGVISGTPTAAGTFNITLAAANAAGTGYGKLVLTIADVTQPTIQIVSPSTNITVVVGNPISLAATVTDPDKVLAQVEFLVNGTVVGSTSASGPFHTTAAAPAPGTYTLSAVAIDTEGRTSTSSVTVTAVAADTSNPPPSSNLLTPLEGLNLAAGSTITLSAAANTISPAGLDHVAIVVNGDIIAVFDANGNPITTAAAGKPVHRQDASSGVGGLFQTSFTLPGFDTLLTMIVEATDKLNQTTVSSVTTVHSTVTTDRAPIVAFINLPATVDLPVGVTEQADVSASDPDAMTGAISSGRPTRQDSPMDSILAELTYFLNGVNIGSSSEPPYTFNFSAPTTGIYTLHAVATDAAGLSTVSDPVVVNAVVPATVTVAAGGDGMAMVGGEKGKVFVERTGDTSAPLTVSYKVKGSAVAGVDYISLPGTVTIPAGASKAKVKIKPIDDTTATGPLKVKIKLLPSVDGTYTVGGSYLVKVTIIDND